MRTKVAIVAAVTIAAGMSVVGAPAQAAPAVAGLTIWADQTRANVLTASFPKGFGGAPLNICLLYTSPSPRDRQKSRMPSSA